MIHSKGVCCLYNLPLCLSRPHGLQNQVIATPYNTKGKDVSPFFPQLMILHNFGAVCVGETIEETFHTAFFFVKACENQVRRPFNCMENNFEKRLR